MKKIKAFFMFIIAGIAALVAFAGCGTAQNAGDGDAAPEPLTFVSFMKNYWWMILLVLLVVVWFFFSSSRRKKQAQEGQNMLESIRPGAYVMTQGGVIGKVTEVIIISATEKHVVLETGGDENKSYIKYDIRAIGAVLRPEQLMPRPAAEPVAMPTDEEVQMRLEDVYTAPAETAGTVPAAEDIFAVSATGPASAAGDVKAEPALESAGETVAVKTETKKPAAVKKPAAKKPAAKKPATAKKTDIEKEYKNK